MLTDMNVPSSIDEYRKLLCESLTLYESGKIYTPSGYEAETLQNRKSIRVQYRYAIFPDIYTKSIRLFLFNFNYLTKKNILLGYFLILPDSFPYSSDICLTLF